MGAASEFDDLRPRILAARLPEKEPVSASSQGMKLETVQKLAHYWATQYDWRKVEARLATVPQFITEIDEAARDGTKLHPHAGLYQGVSQALARTIGPEPHLDHRRYRELADGSRQGSE